MIRKIILTGLCILVLTGCNTNNEDPTNIELEVLRASLLEKELLIDELQDSIAENQTQKSALERQVQDFEQSLEDERALKQQLLDEQPQVLTVHNAVDHYYQVVGDSLYLLLGYDEDIFDYYYEELIRFRNTEPSETVYRGSQIQFDVDRGTGYTFILDLDQVKIINQENEVIYEDVLDLNDPLIDLTPTLYLADKDGRKNYVFMTKSIQEDTKTLLGIISYDYLYSNEVIKKKYYLNTKHYLFDTDNSQLFYEETIEEQNYLYRLNLKNDIKETIAVNPEKAFELYIDNGQIYYFDEESDRIIRYDSN